MVGRSGPRKRGRPGKAGRRHPVLVVGTTLALVASALLFSTAANAVLIDSPSKFESGNDPSLGLGNMVVNTTGNKDWTSVTGEADYVHLTDKSASTSDDSFTPGQKQDEPCPTVEGHKNPNKDDFTDVASFTEVSTAGETFLYGATMRVAANGNASENIELKQGTSGDCVPGFFKRTPGDKLIAIDYLGGGSAVQFHVLTWVGSGACFVGSHSAPCWGADVLELNGTTAEGGVSTSNITAANNPISGVALQAGKFAEFGINLADAGIIPAGSCKSFSQTVWESRAAGSSFVSSTKDISIEDKDINNCPTVDVTKVGSDGGSQEGAEFTLYEGSDTTGDVVGTCTVDANGDCGPDEVSFTELPPGTYTIDETVVPDGYGKDPNLPETFTLAAGDNKVLEYTDPALEGALSIVKNSTKGGAVANSGAVFSYGTESVTDNGTGDEDDAIGSVCVSGLDPGDYTVNETTPPDGYGGAPATEADQEVTVENGTDCTDNLPGTGATATFTNPPLSDIQVNFRDGGSGETALVTDITCDNETGSSDTDAATGWDDSLTIEDIEAPTKITCVIDIDP